VNVNEVYWRSDLELAQFSRNECIVQSFAEVFGEMEISHEPGGGAAIGHLLVAYHVYIIWR
jgi:hypothetical protein